MINRIIAESMDMEIPEEQELDDSTETLTTIEPHELVVVDNNDLPDMSDIDRTSLEGEKQLEILIRHGLGQMKLLQDGINEVEAKYRNRYIDNVIQANNITLDAIKHKNLLQIEKKKIRMKEAEFSNSSKSGSSQTTNNVFLGSREDLLNLLDDQKQ